MWKFDWDWKSLLRTKKLTDLRLFHIYTKTNAAVKQISNPFEIPELPQSLSAINYVINTFYIIEDAMHLCPLTPLSRIHSLVQIVSSDLIPALPSIIT